MAELNVSRKNILTLFSDMRGKKFIIPEYQRPYKWDKELCETLWQDLTGFYDEAPASESEYYLGTVVTCKTDDSPKNVEVIDGQQRIISLLLLLRAFYQKLESYPLDDDNIAGLKIKVGPCIWDVDPISGKVNDKQHFHIESKVATEEHNETFHQILESGQTDPENKDLYSTNYRFFSEQCDNYVRDKPANWQKFYNALLMRCIILPIECETFETAVRIFTTLNDRGMPLSDSDLFKAEIYKSKKSREDKHEFAEKWKELTETVEGVGMSLNDLFRYYSHVIRARDSVKTKEIALRKFYEGQDGKPKYERLREPKLMEELSDLAEFWVAVAKPGSVQEGVTIRPEAFRRLHCLENYPNDFWKYVTSVFYLTHRDRDDFAEQFSEFLAKVTAYLFSQFVMNPTVNAIKDPVYQFCIDVAEGNPLKATFALTEEFRTRLSEAADGKISRAFILLHAYLNPRQKKLLPKTFEIEHILPRKWQTGNYRGWSEEDAAASLERFGNKVAIEKKVNIQAGNDYFGEKKKKYAESKIANVLDLMDYRRDKKDEKYTDNDWAKYDIDFREKEFLDTVLDFLRSNLPTQATENVEPNFKQQLADAKEKEKKLKRSSRIAETAFRLPSP